MSILNVNKINPIGSGSTVTIAGIASVTNNISVGNSVTASSFHGDTTGSGAVVTATFTGDTGNVRIDLHSTASGTGSQIKLHNDHGTVFFGQAGDTTGDLLVYNESNTNIRFFTNGNNERLRITSDGNALVGTTNATTIGTVNRNLIVGSTTNAEEVALTLNVMEGTNNRRVKFFLDDDDGEFGIDSTASTGVAPFVVRMGATEKLRITSDGYVTKVGNPVFHAFGGPSNVATNTDIVFGQERFDVGGGYNTSTGEYTAPATGYYHFYAQVYRQTTSSDTWWGFYLDTGSGYSQISESRLENDANGHTGSGYATLQCSIYWYMTAGHKIKCRAGSTGAVHCNTTLSYFCGNLVG